MSFDTEKKALIERYRQRETSELINIQSGGGLTDVANQAMSEVLRERSVTPAEINEIKEENFALKNERLASIMSRLFAKIIDSIIGISASLIFVIPLQAGIFGLIYILYILLADGLFKGQSLGKKVFKIATINKKTGEPCTFSESIFRNVSLSILGFIDALFIFGKARRRLGDLIAGTEVVNVVSKAGTDKI